MKPKAKLYVTTLQLRYLSADKTPYWAVVSYSEVGAKRSNMPMDFTDCFRLQSDNPKLSAIECAYRVAFYRAALLSR